MLLWTYSCLFISIVFLSFFGLSQDKFMHKSELSALVVFISGLAFFVSVLLFSAFMLICRIFKNIDVDNIIDLIDLQAEAYRKDDNIPERLFEIYDEQKKGLNTLKENFGSIVTPAQLEV